MGRLYRPFIPITVKIEVAERQRRQLMPDSYLEPGKTKASRLAFLLRALASHFGCDLSELRLDHDPPLGARVQERRGLGRKTYYIPDANDPDHLFYRPHGPEFEGSHLIKTNVRGDHGQHPDRVLIKKMRRLERGPKPKKQFGGSAGRLARPLSRSKKSTWPKRPFPKRKS